MPVSYHSGCIKINVNTNLPHPPPPPHCPTFSHSTCLHACQLSHWLYKKKCYNAPPPQSVTVLVSMPVSCHIGCIKRKVTYNAALPHPPPPRVSYSTCLHACQLSHWLYKKKCYIQRCPPPLQQSIMVLLYLSASHWLYKKKKKSYTQSCPPPPPVNHSTSLLVSITLAV